MMDIHAADGLPTHRGRVLGAAEVRSALFIIHRWHSGNSRLHWLEFAQEWLPGGLSFSRLELLIRLHGLASVDVVTDKSRESLFFVVLLLPVFQLSMVVTVWYSQK